MNVTDKHWGESLGPVASPSSVFSEEALESLHLNTVLDEVIYKHARDRLLGTNDVVKVFRGTLGGVARGHLGQYCIWAIATGIAGNLVYGPYEIIFPGRYVADFRLRLDASCDDGVKNLLATVDLACHRGNSVLAERQVRRADFSDGQEIIVSVAFDVLQPALDFEIRVTVEERARIWASTEVPVRTRLV